MLSTKHLSEFEWPRYRRLVDFVCSNCSAIVTALCKVADVTEVEPVAKALLVVTARFGDPLQLVRACVRSEFTSNASRPSQIFRTQNLASRAVGAHARMIGARYLRHTLSAVVTGLMNERESLEVDLSRFGADQDEELIRERVERLRLWSELAVARISAASALAEMPRQMRDMLSEIKNAAKEHGLDQKQVTQKLLEPRFPSIKKPSLRLVGALQTTCIPKLLAATYMQVSALLGGYLFLRFFNPAIVAPEAQGLSSAPPSPESRRSLVLLSKVLQVAVRQALVACGGSKRLVTADTCTWQTMLMSHSMASISMHASSLCRRLPPMVSNSARRRRT